MDPQASTLAFGVFVATLLLTFAASVAGRVHARGVVSTALSEQKLNRWLVGLSAGATANSGFVVTGAVGLGYAYGAQWIMLPLAWLLGDIVFWALFPHRINALGARTRASSMIDVLVEGIHGNGRRVVQLLTAAIIIVCLGGYVAAQWLAGEKFVEGAFGMNGLAALVIFAAVIVAYTAIGGFRGSIYADSLQAVIRVIGTAIALTAVVWVSRQTPEFQTNWAAAGTEFLNPFPQATVWGALAFVAGYAAAALGFGLGQPQMITRYLAGATPAETRAAWWIYLGFVQFTWVAMTVFGIVLRGVMPNLSDPEAGLSVFFRSAMGPVLTGLIVADVFATIAATSNSLLVSMSQTLRFDLLDHRRVNGGADAGLWPYTVVLGFATMGVSLIIGGSVFDLALASVALLGAALAPAMASRLFGWRPTARVLTASIATGFATAAAWKFSPVGASLNEAIPGMVAAGIVIALSCVKLGRGREAVRAD